MKFSIITCTYNSSKYLQKNIDSVKNQTCRDFEHVLIDGFSIDGTVEMIKKYQQEFPDKVKFFQFPANGIANAMNRGIEKSSGEYLTHLHSDDNFYDNKILQDVEEFIEKKNNPDWIYGKINVVEENDASVGIFPERKFLQLGKNPFSSYLLKFLNFIPHQAVFIKKKTIEKFGCFDESLKSSMDYDLWLKLRKTTSWVFFDKTISNYRIRPNAQSSGKINQKENQINLNIVQKRHLNNLELLFSKIINKIINKINRTLR